MFLYIVEMVGAFAAAISGIRLASMKRFDWFGAYIVGLVTALGGGTLRDVLLDIPVFWTRSWDYFAVTGISMSVVIAFQKQLVRRLNMLLVFDAVGLAMFTVIGVEKTLAIGLPVWVAIRRCAEGYSDQRGAIDFPQGYLCHGVSAWRCCLRCGHGLWWQCGGLWRCVRRGDPDGARAGAEIRMASSDDASR